MDIFTATEKIKEFVYEGNNSILKIGDELELSAGQLSVLYSLNEITDIKEYIEKTKKSGYSVGLHYKPKEFVLTRRIIKFETFDSQSLLKNTAEKYNTKEYWNFLHEEFQYCDVMSYPTFPDLESYFGVKGPLYDSKIDLLPNKLQFFKDKKILEIGGGYGYLPKTLKENKIPHTYYHADIVKRFDCDNFIDLDGYNLSPFISEKFDVILMFDVFQHLNIHTMVKYFHEMSPLLKDNGVILVDTPIFDEEKEGIGTFFAQTYIHPSKNTFIKTLNNCNFQFTMMEYDFMGRKEGRFYTIKHFKK